MFGSSSGLCLRFVQDVCALPVSELVPKRDRSEISLTPELCVRCTISRMANNLVRFQESGNLHFLTFSCYRRLPYFRNAERREIFERALEAMRVKYDFYINAYVVMPEHVHLLLSEPKKAVLAKAIQALKISVSMQQKERPFWMHRYYDYNVYSQYKFQQKLKYIHRNPVSRGLVEKPEDWAWSSFRHYATGVRGVVEVESSWLASARDRAAAKAPISKCERSGAPA